MDHLNVQHLIPIVHLYNQSYYWKEFQKHQFVKPYYYALPNK